MIIPVIGVFVGVVSLIMVFYQVVLFIKYIGCKCKTHVLVWEYDKQDWRQYSKHEMKIRISESRKLFVRSLIIIPLMISVLILAYFANKRKGDIDTANAMINPFVLQTVFYLLLAAVAFLLLWFFMRAIVFHVENLLSIHPRVLAGGNYIILHTEFYFWKVRPKFDQALSGEIVDDKYLIIKYKKKITLGGSNDDLSNFKEVVVRIPIPDNK
ncbi:MAG TPA: hypothetical protein VF941_06870, partial [Clostridia bacterium]